MFLKKMIKSQLKGSGMPEEQQDKIIEVMMENPDLFKKIAEEAQTLIKDKNMDQMSAIMSVAGKYKDELGEISKKLK